MTDPTLPDPAVDASLADLCSVQRSAGGVVALHFGRRVDSGDDGAVGAALQHRVLLGAGGAERLQDLLTALLQEPAA